MRPFEANKVALSGLALLFFSQLAAAASAVLGIDLGQEFIKAALVKPGIPLEIVLTKDSKRKEASVITFKPPHDQPAAGEFPYADRLYGGDALAVAPRFPHNTYPNLKQILARLVSELPVIDYSRRYPALSIVPSKSNTVAFKSDFAPPQPGDIGVWTVEELLAMQLENIKKNAEAMAGKGWKIRDCVIAIPTYYTAEERAALTNAAELAGLKVMALISDGVAVGVNYAMTRSFPVEDKPQHHIIYDMGAGSTTASLVKIQGKSVKDIGKYVKNIIEVSLVSVGYDRTLGGDILTERLVDRLASDFAASPKGKKLGEDEEKVKQAILLNGRAAAKLWKEATRVRHILSANSEAVASIESLIDDIDFRSGKILRSEFEDSLYEDAGRITLPIQHILTATNMELKDIDSVILHGGAIRTPFVLKQLEEFVGAEKIAKNVNADEAAVLGATFHGAGLSNSFKVKEIRAKDYFEYPGGVKYKQEGKVKFTNDEILNSREYLGNEKTVTFKTRVTDFDFTLYHMIPPPPNYYATQPRDIAVVTTGNLTETTQKLKSQYNCTDETISTKATIKINEFNGVPGVTSVWAECEALVPVEVKKVGILDGVKNFLGLNKDKTDKKNSKKDSKTESKTETKTGSETSTSTETTEPSVAAAADGEQKPLEKKEEEPKLEKKVVKIPVKISIVKGGLPALSKTDKEFLTSKIANYRKYDEDKNAREEARNVLEAFVYKGRGLLEDANFVAAASEEERKKFDEKLSAAMEWLYEDGASAALSVVKDRIKELTDIHKPINKRLTENTTRPEVLKKLQEALETGKDMILMITGQIPQKKEEGKEETKDEKASETPAPEPVPASEALRKEAEVLLKHYNEVETWLAEQIKLQDALKPYEDPVLTTNTIEAKLKDLNQKIYTIFQKKMVETHMANEKAAQEKEKAEKAKKEAEKAEKGEKGEEKEGAEAAYGESASSTASAEEAKKSVHDEL